MTVSPGAVFPAWSILDSLQKNRFLLVMVMYGDVPFIANKLKEKKVSIQSCRCIYHKQCGHSTLFVPSKAWWVGPFKHGLDSAKFLQIIIVILHRYVELPEGKVKF